MVAVAIGGSALLSAGIGAISSANAASAQKKAALAAQQTQLKMFEEGRAGVQPFVGAGQAFLGPLEGLAGVGPGGTAGIMSTLESLPGYQFTLGQGLKSVQNSYAARGLGTSGAALKGASQYATGLAQSNYNNYFNQLLAGANLGAGAAESVLGNAVNAGANVANAQIGYGNAAAGGAIGVGNALSGGLSGAANAYLLNSLLGGSGGGYTGGFVPVTPSPVTGQF